MTSIQEYNSHIADLLLQTYRKMIDHENKVIRGGGGGPQEQPLPILGNQEPYMGIDPEGCRGTAGKLKIPKVIKEIGHETGKIVGKSAKKAGQRIADAVADKAVNSLINHMNQHVANSAQEAGAGVVQQQGPPTTAAPKRARKSKAPMEGGKLNFIKAISHIGSKVADKVGNVVINKGIDKGIKYLTSNPEVAEEGAEVAAEAAGLKKPKKKRRPSRRNLVIGELMPEHKMSMAQANAYIKKHGL